VLRGEGTRTRLGQIRVTGGEDSMGQLTNVVETLDLENGRAALDYDITNEGFNQHRTEVLTSFEGEEIGWGTSGGRPRIAMSPGGLFSWSTQNNPQMVLRRNVISVALAAAEGASNDPVEERTLDGEPALYGTARVGGELLGLYFDPDTKLLDAFTTLDTETMLGDVEARYLLDDYRSVDGLTLPHSITIEKQGRHYSSIDYSSIVVNDESAAATFDPPDDVLEQARRVVAAERPWVPLELVAVAPGVYHAAAFSHDSMVVEFPTFVAVVEGAYTEAQSMRLNELIAERIGKPIRYVIPSHPHYDHTGGIRGLAASGATVLVAAGHEAELRAVVEAPPTNPPDLLARRRAAGEPVGGIEAFSGMHVIEDGDQRLELYEVDTIQHVRPKTLAYVPSAEAIFQSDLFFGGASPDATAFYEAIERLGLEVEHIIGGHGGVQPWSALEAAVASAD
jgi:hypothetical protein